MGYRTASLSMHKRRIYKAHPNCRWRTSRSRARSSRVYHTSYPVSVRRPASLDCLDTELVEVDFLQTPPHDDALVLLLTLGSANIWCKVFHLASYVPCLAHTLNCAARLFCVRTSERLAQPQYLIVNDCLSARFIILIALYHPTPNTCTFSLRRTYFNITNHYKHSFAEFNSGVVIFR